jgi:hypothetical protein
MKDAQRVPIAFTAGGPAREILQDVDVDRRAPAESLPGDLAF